MQYGTALCVSHTIIDRKMYGASEFIIAFSVCDHSHPSSRRTIDQIFAILHENLFYQSSLPLLIINSRAHFGYFSNFLHYPQIIDWI